MTTRLDEMRQELKESKRVFKPKLAKGVLRKGLSFNFVVFLLCAVVKICYTLS